MARKIALRTDHPLILTARVAERDLQSFDLLRKRHFPPDRNHLHAHLTMFHRLPGEHIGLIIAQLTKAAAGTDILTAEVSGLRHLGAGVAYAIASTELHTIRADLKTALLPWLGAQDLQKWQPHITVQNKASKAVADALYDTLLETFRPHSMQIIGLDLWTYLNGPWRHEGFASFTKSPVTMSTS